MKCEADLTVVLVLVAAEVERDAFIKEFHGECVDTPVPHSYHGAHTVFHLGIVGEAEILLAQSGQGSDSPHSVTLTAADLVQEVSPDFFILAGIGYGLKPKEQQLSEIMVSTQIRNMNHRKVTKIGKKTVEVIRGDKVSASTLLVDRLCSTAVGWAGAKIHYGLILSSNDLVNSKVLVDHFKEEEPDAIGGEMEGSGVYSVGAKRGIPWVVVKAISDWGYNKDDSFQAKAAVNVAIFLREMLSRGGLSKSVLI